MISQYFSQELRQLRDQQVRYAPRDKRLEQVNRAERLLAEIDPARTYTYEYLCYRITDFRPDTGPGGKISGADALHDLRLFIADVSGSADISVQSAGEPVLSLQELAEKYQVSSKTVSRWRQQGLVGRRFKFGARTRLGFLQSSVERFVKTHGEQVERGARFSKLTEEERDMIVRRARRLAAAGANSAQIVQRLARRLGRSAETVRYTLKAFDREHAGCEVFGERPATLTAELRRKIDQEYRRGVSVEVLARRYDRTKATIYRIVNEARANRLLELPLDYIDNPDFAKPSVYAAFTAPMPESETPVKKVRSPAGLPPYLASLYDTPLLSREQEAHLFRKMNYLKYKAARLRASLVPSRARQQTMDQIESLHEEAVQTKNQIIRANLRLVVSIAKRHVGASDDFFELISDGNMSLIRAVEKFDYARGNKFSTYASWAIMKNFARTIPDELKRRDRFRATADELFTATEDERTDQFELENAQAQRELQVGKILETLDDREQQIIISRFGLARGHEPQTLKAVGAEMGVTKERVRQIEARALSKLRKAAEEEHIDQPGP